MKQSEINVIKNICSLQDLLTRKKYAHKTQNLPMLNVALLQKLAEVNDTLRVATETLKDEIIFVYVGIKGLGIVAQYSEHKKMWYECFSHGNCGKNYSCGGTWSVGAKSEKLPEILENYIAEAREGLAEELNEMDGETDK